MGHLQSYFALETAHFTQLQAFALVVGLPVDVCELALCSSSASCLIRLNQVRGGRTGTAI